MFDFYVLAYLKHSDLQLAKRVVRPVAVDGVHEQCRVDSCAFERRSSGSRPVVSTIRRSCRSQLLQVAHASPKATWPRGARAAVESTSSGNVDAGRNSSQRDRRFWRGDEQHAVGANCCEFTGRQFVNCRSGIRAVRRARTVSPAPTVGFVVHGHQPAISRILVACTSKRTSRRWPTWRRPRTSLPATASLLLHFYYVISGLQEAAFHRHA